MGDNRRLEQPRRQTGHALLYVSALDGEHVQPARAHRRGSAELPRTHQLGARRQQPRNLELQLRQGHQLGACSCLRRRCKRQQRRVQAQRNLQEHHPQPHARYSRPPYRGWRQRRQHAQRLYRRRAPPLRPHQGWRHDRSVGPRQRPDRKRRRRHGTQPGAGRDCHRLQR